MQKLIPAVDRVLNIIELLASEQRELSFTELSSSLNIPKPSLSRLLSNLQQRGYVSHNPVTRKYQLTLKLLTLGDRLLDRLDLREKARASMQKLMEESEETVELAILDDKEIVYIDKHESYESVRLVAHIGSRYSTLHPTAVGKVFLAYMSEEDFEYIIRERGLKKFTENTITNVEKLKEEAPMFDHSKKIAGVIGIAGPTFRMRRARKEELGRMVKRAAGEVSNKLGWSQPKGKY